MGWEEIDWRSSLPAAGGGGVLSIMRRECLFSRTIRPGGQLPRCREGRERCRYHDGVAVARMLGSSLSDIEGGGLEMLKQGRDRASARKRRGEDGAALCKMKGWGKCESEAGKATK